jgi:hypothetical protein
MRLRTWAVTLIPLLLGLGDTLEVTVDIGGIIIAIWVYKNLSWKNT